MSHLTDMSEELNIECPVKWKQLWRFLSIFFIVAIWVGITPVMLLRWWKFGREKAFEHMSLFEFFVMMGILSLGGVILMLGIALLVRCAKIQIKEGYLYGRNYWGRKNRIPLNELVDLTEFSSNGINAVVAHSKQNGKVYIPVNIENFEEVIALLATHLPEDISSWSDQLRYGSASTT